DGNRGVIVAALQVEGWEIEHEGAPTLGGGDRVQGRVHAADAVVAEDRNAEVQPVKCSEGLVLDLDPKRPARLGLAYIPALRVEQAHRGDREQRTAVGRGNRCSRPTECRSRSH